MPDTFSLDHLTVLQCTPPEVVYVAADAGYESVGLRTMPLGIPGEPHCDVAHDAGLLRETRRALNATGLSVSDVELVRIMPGMEPSSFEASFAAAAELGASDVTTSVWATDSLYARDMFDEVCALAAPYGLRLDLEFVSIAEVKTLAEGKAFLESVTATNVGIVLDMYHVHRGGTALAEVDALPPEWFHFCQLCDAPSAAPDSPDKLREEVRAHRLYLGEGGIDVAGIVGRMPKVVYALEIPNLDRIGALGPREYASECLQTTKRYFAEHDEAADVTRLQTARRS